MSLPVRAPSTRTNRTTPIVATTAQARSAAVTSKIPSWTSPPATNGAARPRAPVTVFQPASAPARVSSVVSSLSEVLIPRSIAALAIPAPIVAGQRTRTPGANAIATSEVRPMTLPIRSNTIGPNRSAAAPHA